MTVCEARKLLEGMAPNADIYLRVQTDDRLVPVNYRLGSVTKEGQLVFLEAAETEDMRETNP